MEMTNPVPGSVMGQLVYQLLEEPLHIPIHGQTQLILKMFPVFVLVFIL